jgi:alanine-glyoxylate transaminase/serine-glyoxylate transaminase/serine-pyruvate transaminase
MILEEGIEARWARHKDISNYYRKKLKEMGFKTYVDDEIASPTVVSMYGSDKITAGDLCRRLREEKVLLIGAGLPPMTGKMFRIGNMACQATKEKADHLLDLISDLNV